MTDGEEWISKVETEKTKIKNWKTDDRLSLLAKLVFLNQSLASSITGWNAWLTNALVMSKFSEKELDDLTKDFEQIAIRFLDLDIEYTKKILDKTPKEQKGSNYVS